MAAGCARRCGRGRGMCARAPPPPPPHTHTHALDLRGGKADNVHRELDGGGLGCGAAAAGAVRRAGPWRDGAPHPPRPAAPPRAPPHPARQAPRGAHRPPTCERPAQRVDRRHKAVVQLLIPLDSRPASHHSRLHLGGGGPRGAGRAGGRPKSRGLVLVALTATFAWCHPRARIAPTSRPRRSGLQQLPWASAHPWAPRRGGGAAGGGTCARRRPLCRQRASTAATAPARQPPAPPNPLCPPGRGKGLARPMQAERRPGREQRGGAGAGAARALQGMPLSHAAIYLELLKAPRPAPRDHGSP